MARASNKRNSNRLPKIRVRILLAYMLIFVAVPSLTFITGKWVDRTLSLPTTPPFPFNLLAGFSVFFSGLAVGIRSTRQLYFLGKGLPWGELREEAQAKKLVTTGLYAYTRNPMTLGYSLLPCGMGLMFQSPGMAFFIPTIVLIINVLWLKRWEEPRLEKRFGEEYREYKRSTPFLVPKVRRPVHRPVPVPQLSQDKEVRNSRHQRMLSLSYVSISLLGLPVLAFLTFRSAVTPVEVSFHKQLSLALFGAVCAVGALAGVYPSRIMNAVHFKRKSQNSQQEGLNKTVETALRFEGHHPVCGNFSSHILRLRGRAYCAGCTGLVAGAMASIVATVFHASGLLSFGAQSAIFWIGFFSVVLGILQYSLGFDGAFLHLSINVVFVLGAFLLLASVIELTGNILVEGYLLALIVFWIVARIMLSQLEHEKICRDCALTLCIYERR